MEHITVQFPSIQQLFAFQNAVHLHNFEFNTQDCTLRAIFSEDQLWEALTKYNGKVMARKETA